MFNVTEVRAPYLEFSGLDGDLATDEKEIQAKVRRFALEVMRPTAERLDKIAAQDTISSQSPLWEYLDHFSELGIGPSTLADLPPQKIGRILPIILEELGYGDFGLALTSFMTKMPAFAVKSSGNPELIEKFGNLRGCWAVTQPDRGSDALDYEAFEVVSGANQTIGSLKARVTSSEVILSGRTSQWVACAPIAECALVHSPADYGNGYRRPDGGVFGTVMLVPLDLPGITQGIPSDKLGQRPLPTGDIVFDDVHVPLKYVLRPKEDYYASFFSSLTSGVMSIGSISIGVARAAFEHALKYAHERRQGGGVLADHQHVRWRMFEMWRKIETARAMVRRAAAYNFSANGPHVLASGSAKITATLTALDVTSEAIQIFGGNGIGREFPVEKLLRDIQTAMLEGGENHALGLVCSNWLLRTYQATGRL